METASLLPRFKFGIRISIFSLLHVCQLSGYQVSLRRGVLISVSLAPFLVFFYFYCFSLGFIGLERARENSEKLNAGSRRPR